MRELSGIDSALIKKLAAVYVQAGFAFRVEPIEAPAKQQKKIRRWICGQHAELVRVLPEGADIFSPEYKDGEVLLFLSGTSLQYDLFCGAGETCAILCALLGIL